MDKPLHVQYLVYLRNIATVAVDRNVDGMWASSETCNDLQARFLEIVRRNLKEVDNRMADLEYLKQDL